MPTQNKFFTSLLENIFPLIGVLFFGWSVFPVLLAYWMENIAIGFYHILKMRRATSNYPVNEQNKLIAGPLRPVKSVERTFAMIFFGVHYGFFCFGHYEFLYFFSVMLHEPIHFTPFILLSAVPYFVTHGKNYLDTYIAKKQYETTPLAKLFFSPYRRIFTMHAIIIFGAVPVIFASAFAPRLAVVLILLKIIVDFKVTSHADKLEGALDQAQKSL